MGTIYGYCRVSTRGQAKDGNSLEDQKKAVRNAGATDIRCDSYTGTKMDRPALTQLLAELKAGDTLIVTKLDRFARSIVAGVNTLEELTQRGVTVNILNMGILDNSINSKLFRNILLAFAEYERGMIVERTQEGKAIAKEKPDFKEGRPQKYTDKKIESALLLLESHSYKEVSELTGISISTLTRAKRAKSKQCNARG